MTKTKIALIAALVIGSATAASAQGFDPNPANRYPAYAGANMHGMYLGQEYKTGAGGQAVVAPRGALQSAPVALRNRQRQEVAPQQQFQTAPVALPQRYQGGQQDGFTVDQYDHASSPYAGGVG